MKEWTVQVFISGAILGAGILGLLILNTNSYHKMAKDAMTACEKRLPRDQKCVIIAVPEVK